MDWTTSVWEATRQLHPILIVGICVLIALVGLGIYRLSRRSSPHLTAFSGNAGEVLVSRKALQVLVRRACLNDEWVEAAKAEVRFREGRVETHIELRLSSPENLKGTVDRLHARLFQLLENSLNFEQIGQIRVLVTSFGSQGLDIGNSTQLLEPPRRVGPQTVVEAETVEDPATEGSDKPAPEDARDQPPARNS